MESMTEIVLYILLQKTFEPEAGGVFGFCSMQLCPGQSLFGESVICGTGQEEILVDALSHML